LKDEEGKTLEEETQEIPENENWNKAFSWVVE
jgi:hypothetical protein